MCVHAARHFPLTWPVRQLSFGKGRAWACIHQVLCVFWLLTAFNHSPPARVGWMCVPRAAIWISFVLHRQGLYVASPVRWWDEWVDANIIGCSTFVCQVTFRLHHCCQSLAAQKTLAYLFLFTVDLNVVELSHSYWNPCARSNCLNIHEGVGVKGWMIELMNIIGSNGLSRMDCVKRNVVLTT